MLCQDLCSLAFFQHCCVCGSFTVCRFNWCDHYSAGYRRLSISHMACDRLDVINPWSVATCTTELLSAVAMVFNSVRACGSCGSGYLVMVDPCVSMPLMSLF